MDGLTRSFTLCRSCGTVVRAWVNPTLLAELNLHPRQFICRWCFLKRNYPTVRYWYESPQSWIERTRYTRP
jgi:hypothetical protein